MMAIGADPSGLYRSLNQAEVKIDQFGNYVKKAGDKIGMALSAGFGGAVLTNFAKEIINVRGEMQMLESSFEVLLGGRGVAGFMRELKQFSVDSPLSMNGVANAAQTLLGFGIAAENVMPVIKQIGDISMGNEEKFKSLSLAFAQMSATGKLTGQDLLQMINAGFNPLSVISEKTGKSIGDLKKEMESGAISSQMVADAFASATAEGGQFYGMTQKQAEGIRGLQAQLEGGLQDAFNEIGKSQEGLITDGYKVAISLVENYDKVGKAITALIATYGAYRAAVVVTSIVLREQAAINTMVAMSNGVFNKTLAYQWIWTGRLQKAHELLNKTMLTNPYVLVTSLVVGLVAASWALHNVTTARTKAEEKLKDAIDQINQSTEERIRKSNELISIIQDEAETETKKLKALEDLRSLYPSIFNSMDTEAVKMAEMNRLKQKRNELEEEYTKEQYKQLIAEAEKRRAESQSELKNTIRIGGDASIRENFENEIASENILIEKYKKSLAEITNREWEAATPKDIKKQAILDRIEALKEESKQLEKRSSLDGLSITDPTSRAQIGANTVLIKELSAEYDKLATSEEKTILQNKTYWEKVQKDSEAALNAIDSEIKKLLDSGKTEGIAEDIVESYKKAQKDLAEANANLKLYDYSGKGKIDAQAVDGSIANIKERISKAQKQLEEATSDTQRSLYKNLIKDLESQLKEVQNKLSLHGQEIANTALQGVVKGVDVVVGKWDSLTKQEHIFGKLDTSDLKKVTEGSNKINKSLKSAKSTLSEIILDWDELTNEQKTDAIRTGAFDVANELSRAAGMTREFNEELAESLESMASLSSAVGQLASKNFIGAALTLVSSIVVDIAKKNQDAIAESKTIEGGYWDSINFKIERQIELMKELQGVSLSQVNDTISSAIDEKREQIWNYDITKRQAHGWEEWRASFLDAREKAEVEGNKEVEEILNGFLKDYDTKLKGGILTTTKLYHNYRDVLSGLTDEQLVSLQGIGEIWQLLPEELQKYITDLDGLIKKQKEAKESADEMYTGVSFDTFENSFTDALMDLDSTAKDVAGNIEKYFQKAILKALVDKKYNDQIKALYDQFGEANASDGIDETEYANLQKAKEDLAKAITDERDAIMKTFGWESSSSSDNSLKGAFSKASQESIDVLTGQTAGARIGIDKTAFNTDAIRENMQAMYDLSKQGLEKMEAIRVLADKIEKSNAQIELNTKKIGELVDNTKSTAKNTGDMLTYGLKLKPTGL